ncbi:hypothetical protein [Streptomyces sp. NPDC088350]|uniref:hypothetical protein n=1 Tax=Streptomyces sp. NPDC088350 TaxID=3365854 RepID=UPI0038150517
MVSSWVGLAAGVEMVMLGVLRMRHEERNVRRTAWLWVTLGISFGLNTVPKLVEWSPAVVLGLSLLALVLVAIVSTVIVTERGWSLRWRDRRGTAE